jgi:hypothetical protein
MYYPPALNPILIAVAQVIISILLDLPFLVLRGIPISPLHKKKIEATCNGLAQPRSFSINFCHEILEFMKILRFFKPLDWR